jgi:hypothetical protein
MKFRPRDVASRDSPADRERAHHSHRVILARRPRPHDGRQRHDPLVAAS